MTQAYPLQWPAGVARTKYAERGAFKTTLSNAIKNVQASLALFGKDSGKKLERLVISSNATLGVESPADPGVSVWFTWDGLAVCIAVDRYSTLAANLQAIHHIVEARRVELRHGTLAMVRQTFSGFAALPPPTPAHEVLGVARNASEDEIQAAFRRLAARAHPDVGGSHDAMARLTAARDQLLPRS